MTVDREAILDAAEILVRDQGASRLSFPAIACRLNCPESDVRAHFESPNTLLVEVVAKRGPRFLVPEPQAGSGTVGGNLIAFAGHVVRFYRRGVPLFSVVSADVEVAQGLRAALPVRADAPAPIFRVLSNYFAAEQALGRVRADADPMMLAITIVGPCFMWAFMDYATGRMPFGSMELETYIAGLIDTLRSLWSISPSEA
jgi:AcrR family transcriptional regulator